MENAGALDSVSIQHGGAIVNLEVVCADRKRDIRNTISGTIPRRPVPLRRGDRQGKNIQG